MSVSSIVQRAPPYQHSFLDDGCCIKSALKSLEGSERYSYLYRCWRLYFIDQLQLSSWLFTIVLAIIALSTEIYFYPHCRKIWSVEQLLYDNTIYQGPYANPETIPAYALGIIFAMPVLFVYLPVVIAQYICFRVYDKREGKRGCSDNTVFPELPRVIPTLVEPFISATNESTQPATDFNSRDQEPPVIFTSPRPRSIEGVSHAAFDRFGAEERETAFLSVHYPRWVSGTYFARWSLIQTEAFALTAFITNVMKIWAGRFRPDFVSRLHHEGLLPYFPPGGPYRNNAADVEAAREAASKIFSVLCTNDKFLRNKLLRDGRTSFPSGHSSISFAAMVPLCVFIYILCIQFRGGYYRFPMKSSRSFGCSTRRRGQILINSLSFSHSVLRLFIATLPIFLAIFVAISRTVDYRHNYDDILAGSLIGIMCASLVVWLNHSIDGGISMRNGGICLYTTLRRGPHFSTYGGGGDTDHYEHESDNVNVDTDWCIGCCGRNTVLKINCWDPFLERVFRMLYL